MSKNKSTIIILSICVLGIWGIIFYRVFASISEEDSPMPTSNYVKEAYFKGEDHTLDTVSVNLNYGDPFGGIDHVETDLNIKPLATQNIHQPVILPKPTANFANIHYLGNIINSAQKRPIAIISIEGKEFMMSEGENKAGVKFIKYLGDSVKISYQGISKNLTINK
ncbi:hypothetical protein ACJVDH_05885 [Pedobacter sp. AW1-32]|uniref:hypothetical protein n=1 Tax=Pedobacter sp. AW1-32 TaxID=3383026 RepID=UPI003FF04832